MNILCGAFLSWRKAGEPLHEAHVEGIIGARWIYPEFIGNFSMQAWKDSVMCFAHIPELFSLVEHLTAGPVEVNSCLAFQKDYAPK